MAGNGIGWMKIDLPLMAMCFDENRLRFDENALMGMMFDEI